MTIKSFDIALVGAGVMGGNLARNIAEKGYRVGIFDLNYCKAVAACKEKIQSREGTLEPFDCLDTLVKSLSRPRKIGLLVKAGKPVDEVILELSRILDRGDIVMDMGNSFYKDTQKREVKLYQKGIAFFGVGISGGEKGALLGPSIMAGVDGYGWENVEGILTDICATKSGKKCCRNFGNNGAGHFVKMVHNGIEYSYMEAISEIYMVLKTAYGKETEEIGKILKAWTKNKKVNSYLLEITYEIAIKSDDKGGGLLIDKIKDSAGSKGTGLWTSQTALELLTCAPVLMEALMVRYLSTEDDIRSEYRQNIEGHLKDISHTANEVLNTLEFIQYICFEQGLKIIEKAAKKFGWSINLEDVISVWEAGCIIRTDFSKIIKESIRIKGNSKILASEEIKKILKDNFHSVQKVMSDSIMAGVSIPVISSGLQYYLASSAENLPTSMIQAQRDYFGAHGYERVDLEGSFRTKW